MKISVKSVQSHGKRRFVVSWTAPGQPRKRLYFPTRDAADSEAERLRSQTERAGEVWGTLPAAQRDELIYLLRETEREGFTLRQAVEYFRCNREVATANVTAGAAFQQFMDETNAALLSEKTKGALKSNIGRFVNERASAPLRSITREAILKWLRRPEWGPRTFNTYLTSLNTFFGWCVKIKFLKEAPTATIEKIDERRMPDLDQPPVILSVEQTKRLLQCTYQIDPGLIPYVAIGLFAGLRPEREAGKLVSADIRDGLIHVRGLHAKDRQRRTVEIHPALDAWLKLGGDMPPKNLRRRFEKVREAAGLIRIERAKVNVIRNKDGKIVKRERILIQGKFAKKIHDTGWAQDCLRHTFASNSLPVFGGEKTITQLGHGDYEMLFGHYRALVAPQQAQEFWKLTPQTVLAGMEKAAFLKAA